MTLIEQIHMALDEAFDGVDNIIVRRYRLENEGNPREYIILSPVSQSNTEYANDKGLICTENVDVKYYAEQEAFDESKIKLICDTLKAAGLFIPNGTFYAQSLSENNRLCAVTEVERVSVYGS